jgi:ATP-dependent Zn protease
VYVIYSNKPKKNRRLFFIDEIDAVGERGSNMSVVMTKRPLNQLLTEMDGLVPIQM